MSQIQNLVAGLQSIADDEPKEGRKILTFTPAIKFITGLEIYEWDSKSLGNQPLTSIQAMWLDATDVSSTNATPQSVLVQAGGREIVVTVPGNATDPFPNIGPDPRQGFFLLPSSMPFTIQVSCDLDLQGTVVLALYNFNPFFLGQKYAKDLIKYLKSASGAASHINTGK